MSQSSHSVDTATPPMPIIVDHLSQFDESLAKSVTSTSFRPQETPVQQLLHRWLLPFGSDNSVLNAAAGLVEPWCYLRLFDVPAGWEFRGVGDDVFAVGFHGAFWGQRQFSERGAFRGQVLTAWIAEPA